MPPPAANGHSVELSSSLPCHCWQQHSQITSTCGSVSPDCFPASQAICMYVLNIPSCFVLHVQLVGMQTSCRCAVLLSLLIHALQAWLYFVLLVYNYWVQVRHVPYYHTWVNFVFAFTSCTYAWGAFLLLVATYVRAHWDKFTIAFYCGAVLSIASVGLVAFRCASGAIHVCRFCKCCHQHMLLPSPFNHADAQSTLPDTKPDEQH